MGYKYKKLDILQLPVKSSLEHIQISSELAARLVPQEVRPGLAVATVTGQLTVKDNSYSLGLVEDGGEGVTMVGGKRKRESRSSSAGPSSSSNKFPLGKSKAQHYLYGPLDHQEFVAKLTSRGFTDAKVEKSKDAVLIHLSNEESLIQVTETETHLMYEEAENVPAQNVGRLRQVLKDTILSCVAKY